MKNVPIPLLDPGRLENLSADERIVWTIGSFRGAKRAISTSFGIQSAVMLHMVTRHIPDIPVIFIDTGYLMSETYRFAEELTERLNLNLKIFDPLMTSARQEALYGKRWEMGEKALKAYQLDTKVEPMNRAVVALKIKVLFTGRRREQSEIRGRLPIWELQKKTWKINPIADWSSRDVYKYLTRHGLPYHPLWEKGYVSVGDWHESAPGKQRGECGIHTENGQPDYQI